MSKKIQKYILAVIFALSIILSNANVVSDIHAPRTGMIDQLQAKEEVSIVRKEVISVTAEIRVYEFDISDEDIELIAWITMAEAEGECEEGKRLVIDTILNRVESEHFPNSVRDVIYQPNQFSSVWNGRADRVSATEEIKNLVSEELVSRFNWETVFFTAGKYGDYGTPLLQVENHYFSSM